jgi:hypothetical protein
MKADVLIRAAKVSEVIDLIWCDPGKVYLTLLISPDLPTFNLFNVVRCEAGCYAIDIYHENQLYRFRQIIYQYRACS